MAELSTILGSNIDGKGNIKTSGPDKMTPKNKMGKQSN